MCASSIATSLAKKYSSIPRFKIRRSTEHTTRIILVGSFAIDIMILLFLIFYWLVLGHAYVIGRIMISLGVLVYLSLISFFVYRKRSRLGAWMLVILYGLVGMLILHTWGINAPIGILILGFVIFLANVMLGSKHIFFVTIGIIGTLSLLQYFNIIGLSQPDFSLLDDTSNYSDVAGYSIIFAIFAVIAWLSGTKMETTLERAIKAEETLQKERDELAIRVEEQTKHIGEAQQKELKQLYKFAELGQLTTIILHELANYLSVLTLDIEDLKERHQNSIAIEHAKESIFYIDTIIDQVRNQIKDSDNTKKFDALTTTKDSIEQLRKKLGDSDIKLFIEDSDLKSYLIFGDPLRLSQAITILVTNAAQANKNKQSEISIEVSSTKSKILISVKDFGTGITEVVRHTLFQPQKSKKGSGLGIGLYVTKQIIDTHFKGKIWLSSATAYTQFNIEIPRIRR
ncbi:MAG: integral rane sensor signal transduction histidine kinase [Candidatus Saccharibacteria bacterium]|nr:integral rane sensor signal transduction histidine kinase [Candidatus Saccharibacteria bacterium]